MQLLGATLPTSMSLTSWAAFGPAPGDSAIVMGDLDVTVEGTPVYASLGIGSWFAFRRTAAGDSAVVTGDMALTQERGAPMRLARGLRSGPEAAGLLETTTR